MTPHEQDLNEVIAVLNIRLERRHIEATEQSRQIGDLKRELAEAQERADWLRGHAEWLSNERDALKAAIDLEKVRADAAERKCEMAEQAAARWHDEYGRIEPKEARSRAQLAEIEEAVFAHFTSGAPASRALHAVREVFVRADEGALAAPEAPGGES